MRTESAAEKWWSRGHATLVEGPTDGDWYMMYHGYENGFYTLGRQTLMEPVEWTDDNWLVTRGYDMSQPIPKPEGGESWNKYPTQMETSGYHHNVAYGFMSLRPAIYAAGEGSVRFSNLEYRALP